MSRRVGDSSSQRTPRRDSGNGNTASKDAWLGMPKEVAVAIIAATATVLGTIVTVVVGPVVLAWIEDDEESPDPSTATPIVQATATASPTTAPAATPTATAQPLVKHQGVKQLPVSFPNSGQVWDLDNDQFLPLGTSIPVDEADVALSQTPHSVVLTPGQSIGDGTTFRASFLKVGDTPRDLDGCADAATAPNVSNFLEISSDIGVGSHICVLTTQKRLAELEIIAVEFDDDSSRQIEVQYTVWIKE